LLIFNSINDAFLVRPTNKSLTNLSPLTYRFRNRRIRGGPPMVRRRPRAGSRRRRLGTASTTDGTAAQAGPAPRCASRCAVTVVRHGEDAGGEPVATRLVGSESPPYVLRALLVASLYGVSRRFKRRQRTRSGTIANIARYVPAIITYRPELGATVPLAKNRSSDTTRIRWIQKKFATAVCIFVGVISQRIGAALATPR
jgi:hypothetical protein